MKKKRNANVRSVFRNTLKHFQHAIIQFQFDFHGDHGKAVDIVHCGNLVVCIFAGRQYGSGSSIHNIDFGNTTFREFFGIVKENPSKHFFIVGPRSCRSFPTRIEDIHEKLCAIVIMVVASGEKDTLSLRWSAGF